MLKPAVPDDIEMRVKASMNGAATRISNTLSYNVTPYAIPPKVTPPGTAPNYVTENYLSQVVPHLPAGNVLAVNLKLLSQKFTQAERHYYMKYQHYH